MNDVIENARAWNAASVSGAWAIGDTSSASTRLGQSPLRSPSVSDSFRPVRVVGQRNLGFF